MAKESMKDLEKQVTEDSKNALTPVQMMAGGGEQDTLILVDGRVSPVEVSSGMKNIGLKNWRLPYWLMAGSVILMTYNIHVIPKLIPPELHMFALFLCGTGLLFLAMKKMV